MEFQSQKYSQQFFWLFFFFDKKILPVIAQKRYGFWVWAWGGGSEIFLICLWIEVGFFSFIIPGFSVRWFEVGKKVKKWWGEEEVKNFGYFYFQLRKPVWTSLSRKSFKSVSSEFRIPIDFRSPTLPDSTAFRMSRRCSRSLRINFIAVPKSSIVSLSVIIKKNIPKKMKSKFKNLEMKLNLRESATATCLEPPNGARASRAFLPNNFSR